MPPLVITNARILTIAGEDGPRRGRAMRDLGVIESGSVVVLDGRIEWVGPGAPPRQVTEGVGDQAERIDADGRVVMPCWVDCHTHACWAGNRFDEYEMRLAGAGYLDILRAGGGIMSTVRAVRAASEEALSGMLLNRLERMAANGTGTVEVKTGYGLTPDDELKMLRAIRAAGRQTRQTVIPTFLGAHAVDEGDPECVDRIIAEALPAAVREFAGIACDAFCEEGAWSLTDTRRLFESAQAQGCPIRVHADQFHSLGMTRLAVEMGARSVDHLEAIAPEDLVHLSHSQTIAVLLPVSGFQLDDRYAPAREMVDTGVAVAIASNCNPGTALVSSMVPAVVLAVRRLRLTPAEAIVAATYNASCVLGLQYETGSLEAGKRADLQLLECRDERELGFDVGMPGPRLVVVDGEVIARRAPVLLSA
jgi:imidazolonepropionase